MDRPLIPLVLSYAAGLLAVHYEVFPLNLEESSIAGCICLALYIVTCLKKKTVAANLLAVLLFMLCGCINLYPYVHPSVPDTDVSRFITGKRITLDGVITETPENTPSRMRLHLRVTGIHEYEHSHAASGNLLVSIKDSRKPFHYGDRIRFSSYLRRPKNFSNPGGFDYVRHLAYEKIYVTAYLDDDTGITTIHEGEGNRFILYIEKIRARIRDFLINNLPSPSRDILRALIIGEQNMIPVAIRDQFAQLGITHILSISGLHISIFALVTYLMCMRLLSLCPRLLLYVNAFKIAVAFSVVPVLLYCFIAGFNIPTLRSAIMIVCYLVALFLGRTQDFVHTLFVAAFFALLFIPTSLFDISFQLSFISVLCITLLVPPWKQIFKIKHDDPLEKKNPFIEKGRGMAVESLLASAAAILGTAPLVVVYFHFFSFAGFFTNIVMIPFVGFVIVPLGLLSTLFLFINTTTAALLFQCDGILTDVFLSFADICSRFSGDGIILATPAVWEIVLFYALLFLSAVCLTNKRLKYFAVCVILFLCIEIAWTVYTQRNTGTLTVHFLDVGAGDAAVVEFPGHHVMLIDGGGIMDENFDMGKAVLAPFLYSRGIKKVDILALTHPHQDHTGGLPYIAEHFKVSELWHNGEESTLPAYGALMAVTDTRGIKKVICSQDTPSLSIDTVRIDFLNPLHSEWKACSEDQSHANNNSLVIKLTYGSTSFLFAADILEDTEKVLVESNVPVAATIMKAPHHGGINSSSEAFVQKVSPKVAVISGRAFGNRKIPHPDIERRYQTIKTAVYQTDIHGAVQIQTDGISYWIAPYTEVSN